MMYRSKCWVLNKKDKIKIGVAEMITLKWISSVNRLYRTRNEFIKRSLGVAGIAGIIRKIRLRWCGHVE